MIFLRDLISPWARISFHTHNPFNNKFIYFISRCLQSIKSVLILIIYKHRLCIVVNKINTTREKGEREALRKLGSDLPTIEAGEWERKNHQCRRRAAVDNWKFSLVCKIINKNKIIKFTSHTKKSDFLWCPSEQP